MAEPAMRQSLIISNGSPMIFFERPIAGSIMAVAILLKDALARRPATDDRG